MTTAIKTNEIILLGVSATGAKFGVNGENKSLTWRDLREAAGEIAAGVDVMAGIEIRQSDSSLGAIYERMLRQARTALQSLPRREQGIRVAVITRTGGATWIAEVYDASGAYRRDLMHADEGGDEPHRHLAEQTADGIRARLAV